MNALFYVHIFISRGRQLCSLFYPIFPLHYFRRMDAEKDVQDFGLKSLDFQKLRQIASEKILRVHAAGADN